MKILLAVDDSPYSEEAARTLIARPWPRGIVVRVLTAVGKFIPPAAELWYDAGGDLEYARKIVKERAEYTTERAAEVLQPSGLLVETAVRDGDPRSVIVDEAKEWSADLIIVGQTRRASSSPNCWARQPRQRSSAGSSRHFPKTPLPS